LKKLRIVIVFCIAALCLTFVFLPAVSANQVSEQADTLKTSEIQNAETVTTPGVEPASTGTDAEATEEKEKAEPVKGNKTGAKEKEDYDDDQNGEADEAFEEEVVETMPDPLKPFNRLMFEVNDKLYFYVLKPVARVYKTILPEFVRVSLRNVMSNATTPVRLVNCLLQGKFDKAGIEFSRFMINTTTGVLGIFDVAKKYHHLEKQDEDFGQTLGFYGVKEGFFIVWPVFGPSTVRDTIGIAGDYFSSPFLYVNPTRELAGMEVNTDNPSVIKTTDIINETSLTLGVYEDFKASSIDPYSSMRDAYFEHRRSKIKR